MKEYRKPKNKDEKRGNEVIYLTSQLIFIYLVSDSHQPQVHATIERWWRLETI